MKPLDTDRIRKIAVSMAAISFFEKRLLETSDADLISCINLLQKKEDDYLFWEIANTHGDFVSSLRREKGLGNIDLMDLDYAISDAVTRAAQADASRIVFVMSDRAIIDSAYWLLSAPFRIAAPLQLFANRTDCSKKLICCN